MHNNDNLLSIIIIITLIVWTELTIFTQFFHVTLYILFFVFLLLFCSHIYSRYYSDRKIVMGIFVEGGFSMFFPSLSIYFPLLYAHLLSFGGYKLLPVAVQLTDSSNWDQIKSELIIKDKDTHQRHIALSL